MLESLVNYLKDNKYQIIEVWLTEIELCPPVGSDAEHGGLPIIYLESLFQDIIRILRHGDASRLTGIQQLNDYLGKTFECRTTFPESLVCFEILLAGHKAFTSVLCPEWDAAGEFSEEEYEIFQNWIRKALSAVVHVEIQKCASCSGKRNCPFVVDENIFRRSITLN